ncbi:unnamed protein product [Prorocentrum cordatum]|uniref:Uncharacterized protein n=1 Tax=Prorocentrum cordatum TaxID=2364126 RepID=A0ABN9UK81_9DINO|nr:unnamed protein product [Polarella glacialis]
MPGAGDYVPPKQYMRVMKDMWDAVDGHFDPNYVLTKSGHDLVQLYSIKASHPEMPYAMHFLSMMCALSNGAKIALFPSSDNPLFIFFFNINYAQTRKSSITGNADGFGDQIDKHVLKVVEKMWDDLKSADDEEEENNVAPKIVSSVLHSATPAEFFHRMAGDFQQLQNADKMDHDELKRRHFFGVLVNLDEAHDLLQAFGLLSDEQKASSKGGRNAVNPHQSAFNKLAQYGQASRSTKSRGSYGAAAAPTVSVGMTGNMRPSQYVPMERWESGSHFAHAKERLMVATGRPVQPHEAPPTDFAPPTGHSSWTRAPLLPEIADALGLGEGAASPEAAERLRERPTDGLPALDAAAEVEERFRPNANGYVVTLPDGVETRVRFRLASDATLGFEAEWRIANRSFPTPAAHELQKCCARALAYFNEPHRVLTLTDRADVAFRSYTGCFNVQAATKRDKKDIEGAARMGCAPWQLGQIAGALCVFDIFHGRYDETPVYQSRTIQVVPEHIKRAASLLFAEDRLKAIAAGGDAAATGPPGMDEAAMMRLQMESYIGTGGGPQPFDGLWSQNAFAGDAATPSGNHLEASAVEEEEAEEEAARALGLDGTPQDEPRGAAALGGGASADDGGFRQRLAADGPEGAGVGARADVPGAEELHGAGDLAAAQAAPASSTRDALLTMKDVRSIEYGHGLQGSSVQETLLAPQWTDRAAMQKTPLAGAPAIDRRSAAQRIMTSRAGGGRRKTIDAERWARVMKAGLAGCSIAQFDEEECRVKMPPVPDDVALRHKYHNELMTLCGIAPHQLVEAMQSAKKAAEQRGRAGPGEPHPNKKANRAVAERSRSRSRQQDARERS